MGVGVVIYARRRRKGRVALRGKVKQLAAQGLRDGDGNDDAGLAAVVPQGFEFVDVWKSHLPMSGLGSRRRPSPLELDRQLGDSGMVMPPEGHLIVPTQRYPKRIFGWGRFANF